MRKGACIRDVRSTVIFTIVALVVLSLDLAFAQRPPSPPIDLSLLGIDFTQTGARRAALGGAFIGAAQDETAAFINPACLTFLESAGASLHFRLLKIEDRFDSDQFVAAAFFPIKNFSLAFAREHWFNTRFEFETKQFLTIDSNLTPRQALGGLGNFPGRRVFMDLQLISCKQQSQSYI
ncbi:MAG: hypothetical protein ACE5IR_24380 [bacterium]